MPNYQASLGRIVKSSDWKDKGRISHAVLTFPSPDYDNDYVNPLGGVWVDDPYVNWEHEIPIGTGEVFIKSLPIDGNTQELPIGKTRFFQKSSDLKDVDLSRFDMATGRKVGYYTEREILDAAEDAWRLVNDDIATGVSIEFSPPGPLGDGWHENGNKSLVNRRKSYTFDRYIGLGWAHTCKPINPSARTLEGGTWEKAIRIIETGKFPGGKHISPLVMKSLEAFKKTRPIIIQSGFNKLEKSMKDDLEEYFTEDEEATTQPEGDDAGMDDMEQPELSPTPTEFAKHMQALEDLATDLEGMLSSKSLEHEAGKSRLGEHVKDLRELVRGLQKDAAEMFPDAGLGSPYDDMDDDEDKDEEDDEDTDGEEEEVDEDVEDEELEGDEDEDEDMDDEGESEDDIGEKLEEGLEDTEEEGKEEEVEAEEEEEEEEDKEPAAPIKKARNGRIITKSYPSGLPVKRFKFSDIKEPKKVVKSVAKAAKKQSKPSLNASVVKELAGELMGLASEISGLKKNLGQHS